MKSHIGFRLVSISMTLNYFESMQESYVIGIRMHTTILRIPQMCAISLSLSAVAELVSVAGPSVRKS